MTAADRLVNLRADGRSGTPSGPGESADREYLDKPCRFNDSPLLYAFRQFHAPLEIYRGLQTVLIVSVSSRTAHRLLTASSCNAS